MARCRARAPSAREMTLAPPTPNRLEMACRNIKAGIQTVAAVIIASLPVRPIKNVSAMLYKTRMIWPTTVGTASLKIASSTGTSSNNVFSLSFITGVPPFLKKSAAAAQICRSRRRSVRAVRLCDGTTSSPLLPGQVHLRFGKRWFAIHPGTSFPVVFGEAFHGRSPWDRHIIWVFLQNIQ